MTLLTCADCRHWDRRGKTSSGRCRLVSPIQAACRSCFRVSRRANGELYSCDHCGAPNQADPCGLRPALAPICDAFIQCAAVGDLYKSSPTPTSTQPSPALGGHPMTSREAGEDLSPEVPR